MKAKEPVGRVSVEERDEIQYLFERKNGLIELLKVLKSSDNEDLYEKAIMDMGVTSTRFQQWWDEKSAKYGWISKENGSWEIHFASCTIFVVYETEN